MQTIVIDCAGILTQEEFWQRYIDAANPSDPNLFGRNVDAFWDAIEGGGPGCPGEVELVFSNSEALAGLQLRDSRSFLDMLKEIAAAATRVELRFS